MLKAPRLSAPFLLENYERVLGHLQAMLASDNYVTILQSLRMVRELLSDAFPDDLHDLWTNECGHLKTVMMLLKSKHRNIQTEAVHAFSEMCRQLSQRPRPFQEIILRNRDKLVAYFEHPATAEHCEDPLSRQQLLKTIRTFALAPVDADVDAQEVCERPM